MADYDYEYTWNLFFCGLSKLRDSFEPFYCINRQRQRQIYYYLFFLNTKAVTGVVPFQKVHLFTLLSPKIWILAP